MSAVGGGKKPEKRPFPVQENRTRDNDRAMTAAEEQEKGDGLVNAVGGGTHLSPAEEAEPTVPLSALRRKLEVSR